MRQSIALLLLCLASGASLAASRSMLKNGDFETLNAREKPENWAITQHAGVRAYEFRSDSEVKRGGKRSMMIRRTRPQVFGSIAQTVYDAGLVGATVRLDVWIRSEGVTNGHAVVRIDAANGPSYMERAEAKISGDKDWHRVRVELEIPQYTNVLHTSISLEGDGTVWVDDAKFVVLKAATK